MVDPLSLCQEGYEKVCSITTSAGWHLASYAFVPQFKGKPYKIPIVNGWLVFVNNTDMIDEFIAQPDETLSIYKGLDQVLLTCFPL